MKRSIYILFVALVSLALGCSSTEVSNNPTLPVPFTAQIVASATSGPYPLTLTFTAQQSGLADTSSTTAKWSFADDMTTSAAKEVRHTFRRPGTYEVNLTLTDSTERSVSASVEIIVSDGSPAEFAELYAELSETVLAWEERIDSEWNGAQSSELAFAANLLPANGHNSPLLFNADYYQGTLDYAAAIKSLGCTGVTIEINYPLLTPSFHETFASDVDAYIAIYQRLIADLRERLGFKIYIKHNVILPPFANPASLGQAATAYYQLLRNDPDTLRRFKAERLAETRTMVERFATDYLTIVAETGTWEAYMNFTGSEDDISDEEWLTYAAEIVADLKNNPIAGSTTEIGAGGGTWESLALIKAFAGIQDLDFIDLHIYPQKTARAKIFSIMQSIGLMRFAA